MDILGRNLFWAFLSELLFVILAIILKEDKSKVVTVLIIGTLISGAVGFGGTIISELTNTSISLAKPADNSSSSNSNANTVSQINNPITITQLQNLTFNDQSYQGNGYFDVTLKNSDGASHSVGIRFWYEDINGSGKEWTVFDRVIDNVSGSSNTTSRIVFEPAYASTVSGDKLQATVTSIDNQVIYNSDSVFNAISVELVSSTHKQDGNLVTLTCTFNVTNRLPLPLSADDTANFTYSYIEQGQQVYKSYGDGIAPRWDSENYWGSGENMMGFITIPPSGNTQIVLTMSESFDRYVLKSMEINDVVIEINDEAIVKWIQISYTYKVSGCVWVD